LYHSALCGFLIALFSAPCLLPFAAPQDQLIFGTEYCTVKCLMHHSLLILQFLLLHKVGNRDWTSRSSTQTTLPCSL